MFTTPAPVSITGTRAVSRTKSISFRPPRGMQTSTRPTALSIAAVASWVAGSSVAAAVSMPWRLSTPRIRPAASRFELSASLPPFSTQALPLLKQRANTSNVTLGRASYITPTTPNGTLTRLMRRPFGSVRPQVAMPSGEGSVATLRISEAMPSSLSAVSLSRS